MKKNDRENDYIIWPSEAALRHVMPSIQVRRRGGQCRREYDLQREKLSFIQEKIVITAR